MAWALASRASLASALALAVAAASISVFALARALASRAGLASALAAALVVALARACSAFSPRLAAKMRAAFSHQPGPRAAPNIATNSAAVGVRPLGGASDGPPLLRVELGFVSEACLAHGDHARGSVAWAAAREFYC